MRASIAPRRAPLRRDERPDDRFARIAHPLPGKSGDPGVTADNHPFLDPVPRIARAGAPRPDRPGRSGKSDSTWRRFDRRAREGVWRRAFEAPRDPDPGWLMLDSAVIRAHQG